MSFSSDLKNVALELLSTLGQAVTFKREVINSYNPATGEVDEDAFITYSGYGQPENYESSQIDNVLIQQNDILLLLYSVTEPQVNDIFTVSSKEYTAQNVKIYQGEGSQIMYLVQLRQ